MGRVIKVELTDFQRKELENGYRNGKSHAFRLRCQMVLLKSEGRKSQDIADFPGFCQQAVNNWLNRYKSEGINGLRVRDGRGRPAMLSPTEDLEAIKKAVKNTGSGFRLPKSSSKSSLANSSQRELWIGT